MAYRKATASSESSLRQGYGGQLTCRLNTTPMTAKGIRDIVEGRRTMMSDRAIRSRGPKANIPNTHQIANAAPGFVGLVRGGTGRLQDEWYTRPLPELMQNCPGPLTFDWANGISKPLGYVFGYSWSPRWIRVVGFCYGVVLLCASRWEFLAGGVDAWRALFGVVGWLRLLGMGA